MKNASLKKALIEDEVIVLGELSSEVVSDNYLKWMADEDVLKYLSDPYKRYTAHELKNYIKTINNSDTDYLFGIFLKETSAHIGNIKVGDIDLRNSRADLGLIIGVKALWGKGLGHRAIELATQYAIEGLQLNKISAAVLKGNVGSQKAFDKAGYRFVGKLKKHLKHNDDYYDGYWYEFLRPNDASRVGLGSVQFGMNYEGVIKRKQIPEDQVREIINYAADQRIAMIDTAQDYGDSESILGRVADRGIHFISKLTQYGNLRNTSVKAAVEGSISRLNCRQIYCMLIHHFQDYMEHPEIIDELIKIKEKGLIRYVGFSLYKPEELDYLLEKKVPVDLVQFPFNILDQRFVPYFKRLDQMDIEIHVRSLFLQGAFFIQPEDIPPYLQVVSKKLNLIRGISEDLDIPIADVCINFPLNFQEIDRIIIGVDDLRHLQQNVRSLENFYKLRKHLPTLRSLGVEDENILLPYNWNKAQV